MSKNIINNLLWAKIEHFQKKMSKEKIKIKIEQNCCFLSIFKQNRGQNAQKIFQMYLMFLYLNIFVAIENKKEQIVQ